MGSKRSMLGNGLGEVLSQEIINAARFVDLFAGSAAVSWFIAQRTPVPVMAVDLQEFSTVMAKAVLYRTAPINTKSMLRAWVARAHKYIEAYHHRFFIKAEKIKAVDWMPAPFEVAEMAKDLCETASDLPITKAYGGYYFSPIQALYLDALRATLPTKREHRWVALAALIQAASRCASAPGHTAQPIKATPTGAPSLFEAWGKDVLKQIEKALDELGSKFALRQGEAVVADAVQFVENLNEEDLVFLDPPYSCEHYSRFYHVLETLARGICSEVSGQGRYPPIEERPRSDFSLRTKSYAAFERLLSTLASKGVRAILTYPLADTSNGMSGASIKKLARQYFSVSKTIVKGQFSTLGGNGNSRSPQIESAELILVMHPK
ncbi:MAG TPA: DNA adenine methylase [Nitrososphaera sp.]|jgi:adenine-specific DNA methylase|nr:DNA adenine methylase [Nitrososphaera sp.]